jgi:hypothetical protein
MTRTPLHVRTNRGLSSPLLRAPIVFVLVGFLLLGVNVPCQGQATGASTVSSVPAPALDGQASRTGSERSTLAQHPNAALPCVLVRAPRRTMDVRLSLPRDASSLEPASGPMAGDPSSDTSPGGTSSGGGPPPTAIVPPVHVLLGADESSGSVPFLSPAQTSLSTQRTVVLRL